MLVPLRCTRRQPTSPGISAQPAADLHCRTTRIRYSRLRTRLCLDNSVRHQFIHGPAWDVRTSRVMWTRWYDDTPGLRTALRHLDCVTCLHSHACLNAWILATLMCVDGTCSFSDIKDATFASLPVAEPFEDKEPQRELPPVCAHLPRYLIKIARGIVQPVGQSVTLLAEGQWVDSSTGKTTRER